MLRATYASSLRPSAHGILALISGVDNPIQNREAPNFGVERPIQNRREAPNFGVDNPITMIRRSSPEGDLGTYLSWRSF